MEGSLILAGSMLRSELQLINQFDATQFGFIHSGPQGFFSIAGVNVALLERQQGCELVPGLLHIWAMHACHRLICFMAFSLHCLQFPPCVFVLVWFCARFICHLKRMLRTCGEMFCSLQKQQPGPLECPPPRLPVQIQVFKMRQSFKVPWPSFSTFDATDLTFPPGINKKCGLVQSSSPLTL